MELQHCLPPVAVLGLFCFTTAWKHRYSGVETQIQWCVIFGRGMTGNHPHHLEQGIGASARRSVGKELRVPASVGLTQRSLQLWLTGALSCR